MSISEAVRIWNKYKGPNYPIANNLVRSNSPSVVTLFVRVGDIDNGKAHLQRGRKSIKADNRQLRNIKTVGHLSFVEMPAHVAAALL